MNAQVISFNCIVKSKAGHFISSTFNREVLTVSEMIPGGVLFGLNKNMQNLKKGERRTIAVAAEEGYGLYDPNKVILFPRKKLPRVLRKGEMIKIVDKSGVSHEYQVLALFPDLVSLDGNHPLAGQDLIFEIETLEAREATRDEIEESLSTVDQRILH